MVFSWWSRKKNENSFAKMTGVWAAIQTWNFSV
jgi:hypothetical protein